MAALGADAVEQPVMVEGRQAFHFDSATQGVGVHVRGERLDHRQRLHQLRRQHIQRHGTTVAFRRGHQSAVDGHAVQVRGDAAHADEAAFALVALHRQARYALQRLGRVVVRQLADAIGMHHAFHAVGTALLLERLVDAHRLADHLDVLDARLLRQRCRAGRNGQRQQADSESLISVSMPMSAHPVPSAEIHPGRSRKLQRTVGRGHGSSVTAPGQQPRNGGVIACFRWFLSRIDPVGAASGDRPGAAPRRPARSRATERLRTTLAARNRAEPN